VTIDRLLDAVPFSPETPNRRCSWSVSTLASLPGAVASCTSVSLFSSMGQSVVLLQHAAMPRTSSTPGGQLCSSTHVDNPSRTMLTLMPVAMGGTVIKCNNSYDRMYI
jgi:hypothetical protein